MSDRAAVTVYKVDGDKSGSAQFPDVFKVHIRQDLVQFVHTNMRKNSRQAYGVKCHFGPTGIVAGHQHSAHSWGTGRAVSRIPRVSGGGTHRAGQGAFGNMCRGGRMFAPTKVYRKWHRKINLKQRRQATASCLAASASQPLVQARGHKIENVQEIPIVAEAGMESIQKTKEAIDCLELLGLDEELIRCAPKTMRPGKGKRRNRRFKRKRGPLIIYKEDNGLVKAFRNIPGVDLCCVTRLNLLQLAPGGHIGRLVVWTQPAFEALSEIWNKEKLSICRNIVTSQNIQKIINSDEIQTKLRPTLRNERVPRKKNFLKRKRSRRAVFGGVLFEDGSRKKQKKN